MSDPIFFSVVMASYLGEYGGRYGTCATNREYKFRRAVQSVIDQSEPSWELIVVSDGCDKTMSMVQEFMARSTIDQRIRFLSMPKQRLWSEAVRNAGILQAKGRYIVYLDTDDMFLKDHLFHVKQGIEQAAFTQWGIMDDLVYDLRAEPPVVIQRVATMDRSRGAGTSQIFHLPSIVWPPIDFRYPAMGYDHDEQFFRHLKKGWIGARIAPPGQYLVCHIPNQYDL